MSERNKILPPYTRRVNDLPHLLLRIVGFTLLVLVAMFMGLSFAILPLSMILIPLTPILVLAGFALWMLPSLEVRPDRLIVMIFFIHLAITLTWPEYIAITIPGIGWMPFNRIAMLSLMAISLYGLASAPSLRKEVKTILTSNMPMLRLFIGLLVLQVLLAIITNRFSTRFAYALIFWYYLFIIACWVLAHEGAAKRFRNIWMICMAIQGYYVIREYQIGVPMWTGHIPSFMQVDPELLGRVLGASGRLGSDKVRAGSIYLTSMTFAEMLALSMPFAVHSLYFAPNLRRRILALALICLMLSCGLIFTDQRSAVIGIIIALFGYPAFWAMRRMRTAAKKRDIWGSAVFWGYPAGAAVLTMTILSSTRLRTMTLGGGQHAFSDNARKIQWELTIDRVLSNPFGYGPFSGGRVVGYRNRGGTLTIDGYHMNLLVEYGPLGFLLFAGFFFTALYVAIRTFYFAETEEEKLAGPLAVSLVSFIIIRTVLSQQENFTMAYMMVAMVLALAWRQKQRLAGQAGFGPLPAVKRKRGKANRAGQAVPADWQ